MSDFRLKIFYAVAKNLSFTKAAEELYISQPAVTKNIKELESEYDLTLFLRKGNKIELTDAGKILLIHSEKIMNIYKQIQYDFDLLKENFSGTFQLGASTTLGQYLLPALMSQFHSKHPKIKMSLITANTEEIEKYLIEKKIELGMVEGKPKNKQLKYLPFLKDEIVAIAHTSQEISKKEILTLDELKKVPLVLRELGSGSLDIIRDAFQAVNIQLKDLNIAMHLGSTEGIKSYLTHTNSIGFISIAAVTKDIKKGEFQVIDIEGIDIKRWFYFVYKQGVPEGNSDLFIKFATSHYNPSL
ncbi:LysR family transcriptional regulator [Apibacter sp. B3889]|uniref:LysR family transcriptional regulator n=1 Tax=unclassified Apibacter TaxID=2630820 RepID=UPI0013211A06|nr:MULTISPECIES: LysR family transcriptional regulator [unclassified Apibacter]MXO34768.1 LysR family transcriptional regulator [Apibacter sp. B3883]MXO42128.1 LysR family transcriptional regulator [Apibacter sp. B3889]MXP03698.1 LysR family transcriptional regulator [Apibacter sp. B3887]MXP08066.1 LysR family transcriptional regulator [Apibacter sp. B3935]